MQGNKPIKCQQYGCGHIFSQEELASATPRVDHNDHTGQERGALELRCPQCGHEVWVLAG